MFFKRNLLIIAAALTALPALAQFAKPEDAIKYRKSSFFVMGQHFGRIGAMAQGRVPFDAKAAADNAAVVEIMSKLHWAAFTEGSDKGETRAKPEIWKDAAKFKEAVTNSKPRLPNSTPLPKRATWTTSRRLLQLLVAPARAAMTTSAKTDGSPSHPPV